MINAIPIIGWLLAFGFNVSLAIPFWISWTVCGIGAKYFYWMPRVYQQIPFWDCVGLCFAITILRTVLLPRLGSSSSASTETQSKNK